MPQMKDLLDQSRLKNAMCALREDGERNLKASRHSFITTPTNLGARFLNQLHPDSEPLTWFSALKIALFLLWRIQLTFLSLLVIYGISLAIAAVGNMSVSNNGWRLARPPEDQTRAVTTALGVFHLTMVGTLSLLWGFELPIGYPMLLVYSIGGIVATFIGGIVGGTLLVAAWKMLKGTWERMYWPSGHQVDPAAAESGEKREARAEGGNLHDWWAQEVPTDMPLNPSLLDENGEVRREFIDVPDQAG